jgi:hypothetical protein
MTARYFAADDGDSGMARTVLGFRIKGDKHVIL